MRENGNDLSQGHSGKPFQKLINGGARFKIFEECPNGHSGSPENPCAAYLVFVSFDFSALCPIQHGSHDMLWFRMRARTLHSPGCSLTNPTPTLWNESLVGPLPC